MAIYIKRENVYTQSTGLYVKNNGVWVQTDENAVSAYTHTMPCFYKGDAPTTKYVTNLLPQFVQGNYTFGNMNVTSWTGSGGGPGGNIITMNPSKSYSECYIYTAEDFYPMLHVGHTYYLRWWSKTEGSYYGQASYDVYWPIMENRLVKGAQNVTNNWVRFSYVLTLNQSQWPNNTVVDGNYNFRFDVNNQKQYGGPYKHADFILIDLTADYTGQGYSIPSKTELDAKPYFYGGVDIEHW